MGKEGVPPPLVPWSTTGKAFQRFDPYHPDDLNIPQGQKKPLSTNIGIHR
jgi:hypothetical protein